MKQIFLLALSLFVMVDLFGQSQGISYQAVIIDKNPQEIPGVDISGNILPNHAMQVRFTILDALGTIEYQEEQSTTTDAYGMINLTIGLGTVTAASPNTFIEIDWNGAPKDLKVDISLSGTDLFYTDFSFQPLTFLPYAYHKNITATGSMIIDGVTNLKSRLNVTNGSPTFLSGRLTVDSAAILQNELTVNAKSNLKGQVTINAALAGDKSNYDSYPLRVEGGTQGLAVKITGSRSSSNNFVTFWDDEKIQGRIEGQTTAELLSDPEYIFDNVLFANEILRSTVDVAKAVAGVVSASSSSTVCAGLGACVTAPIPSLIVGAAAQLVMDIANLALGVAAPIIYNVSKHANIGITYQSGAGDYAEWLPKLDLTEKFFPGDIVGVKGGQISKSTENADHFMVISQKPIVLGNMPQENRESSYEKVAFMGQVPVKVIGKVQIGDYILPSGSNNGTGIAVSPDNMQPDQYQKIVGVAWSSSESLQYDYINVAVGLNANDGARLAIKQEQKINAQAAEISALKEQINQMNAVLSQVVPNYATLMESNQPKNASPTAAKPPENGVAGERTIIYYDVTKEQILEGIDLAEKTLREKGVDISTNPFFVKLNTEPGYKDSFVSDVVATIKNQLNITYEQEVKSGARVIRF
ncbi:MAG TPA: hypothetical protein VMV56_01645 [Williamwhitmania sp.]|nr:hypothetical protein [Williamwhitmania sp.]